MLYNKNNVRKVNDKKVLHKVGKNWKVVSLALLMAIGGGAAVTATNANANADTTNNAPHTSVDMNAQSGATNSAVQSEVNSLEAPVKVQSANSTSASTSASSNTQSQSSSASVSYLSGDNGSAASYHAKANQENSVYSGYKMQLQDYVNSLNSQFPDQTESLAANYASAETKQGKDQELAAQYSNVAKQSGTASIVNSLASKAGLTAPDFVNSVENSAVSFSNAVQSGSALTSQMSVVNSDAQLIGNIDSNYATSTAYYIKKVAADDSATIDLNLLNNAKDLRQNLIAQNSADLKDAQDYNDAKVANQIAEINSGLDTDYANSLAKSLGYANHNALSTSISSAAKSFKADGDNVVKFNNASNSAVTLSSSDANLYRILSDTNAMQHFNSLKDINMGPISSAMSSADSDIAKYQSAYSSASASASVADILGSHPTLANIFGTNVVNHVTKRLDPAVAQREEQSLSNVISKMNTSAEQSAVSEAKQELLTNADNDSIDSLNSKVLNDAAKIAAYKKAHAAKGQNVNVSAVAQSALQSLVNTANYKQSYNAIVNTKAPGTSAYNSQVSSLANSIMSATASDRAYDEASASSALSAVKASASGYVVNVNSESGGLLNSADYASASNAISGEDTEAQIASTSSSAANSLNNTEIQSASYSNANSEDDTLAGYYAQSYANDKLNDANTVANAQSQLDSFYNKQSDNQYGNILSKANTAKANRDDSAKLAEAFGIHVYNYSPKYLTVVHGGILHQDTNYGSQSDAALATIHKGDQLQVIGVGFATDGILRYLVNFNGQEGFFTAKQGYTKSTYLPAQNHASVTIAKHARVYKSDNFSNEAYAGVTLKPGIVLDNVNVVSEDNTYYGFTRIELPNGDFITANTNFVSVNAKQAPQANNNTPAKPAQKNQTVYFN